MKIRSVSFFMPEPLHANEAAGRNIRCVAWGEDWEKVMIGSLLVMTFLFIFLAISDILQHQGFQLWLVLILF